MSTWDPSRVQNTDGGGLPCATHSKFAIPFRPTFWSLDLVTNVGGAVKFAKHYNYCRARYAN